MLEARYDLQFRIANHDFFYWLVMAVANGAEQIVFGINRPKTTKWPVDLVMRRFETILVPGVALAGLPYRIGDGGDPNMGSHQLRDFVLFLRQGRIWKRLKNIIPPVRKAQYTVTMRRDWRQVNRNSKEDAWREFADYIGAYVVEDYDVQPMSNFEKLAIYEGADMNFGVLTGPTGLLTFTDIPVTIFINAVNGANLEKHLIKRGGQLPYTLPNQRLVWQDDNLDNLKRAFDQWLNLQAVSFSQTAKSI